MQRTLLQVVQEYMDATSNFYVDSIFETDESQQVAKIAERVYYGMVQEFPNLLFTQRETTLDSVSDLNRPNYLKLPDNVLRVQENKIFYNSSTTSTIKYTEVHYLPPLTFLEYLASQQENDNTVIVEGFYNARMIIGTNRAPKYYTCFDDEYLVFDSYNSSVDTTLQSSKSKVLVTQEEVFLQQDDFVIPIPEGLSETYLDLFLNEALTLVHQQPIGMIAQRARAKKIKLQQDNRRVGGGLRKKSYGKRPAIWKQEEQSRLRND